MYGLPQDLINATFIPGVDQRNNCRICFFKGSPGFLILDMNMFFLGRRFHVEFESEVNKRQGEGPCAGRREELRHRIAHFWASPFSRKFLFFNHGVILSPEFSRLCSKPAVVVNNSPCH